MNIIKVTSCMLVLLFLLPGFNAFAETMPNKVVEVFNLSIKLSGDGTGIVKNISCSGCDFNFVRITQQSKAAENGVEVDIQQANTRAGKNATVSFDPQTQEVQFIRW
jgi:hypothetical protein